jgi:hypothetical protein
MSNLFTDLRAAGLAAAACICAVAAPVWAGAIEIGSHEVLQLERISGGDATAGGSTGLPALDQSTEFARLTPDDFVVEEQISGPGGGNPTAAAPLDFPTVANTPIALVNRGFFGFDALDHLDQRNAGTGAFTNTQFSLEPPDQALCVGNGFVVESVNTAIAVYKTNGARIAGPTALNQFFGLAPEVIRTPPVRFGDFTSDPRCYFDRATNRFFVILLQIDVDPPTGNFTGPSHQLIAVSKSGDPTGGFNVFRLTTTRDGEQNCPCFGDQPLLGADANGFYLSANSFSLVDGRFKGVQIYAMSKRALAAGTVPPFVLHIGLPRLAGADGGRSSSVQPAMSRSTESHGSGTEFFLASFNTTQLLNSQVSAFALRPTRALDLPASAIGPTTFSFQKTSTASQVYGVPPDAPQKFGGAHPLADLLDPKHKVDVQLATNEHRMQQVTLADGTLWSTVTTGLQSPGETAVKAGVAWFAVRVAAEGTKPLEARVNNQGYVAIANANAFFPALGLAEEHGAIGFSISGRALFPSTGYVELGENGRTGPVHFAGLGTGSEDGFTGFPSQGSPCTAPAADGTQICEARWGDYGAAAVDEAGNIWIANEYTNARPRNINANWGTFVTRISSGDQDRD